MTATKKTIQARFVMTTDRDYHLVRVRRVARFEALDPRSVPAGTTFKHGDRLEVRRETNNPYLVYVGKVNQ